MHNNHSKTSDPAVGSTRLVRQDCSTCVWLETFTKRPDEISNMGCKQANWAGYVTDTSKPPCGGLAWIPKAPQPNAKVSSGD